MTRNLKALGLALMAAFAFSAVAVSSASAQETPGHLTSESTTVTLTGEEKGGEGANSFTAFGSEVECPGSTYTGHKVDVTDPKEALHKGETEITVEPHYVNCSSPVSMNGCDYRFYDATTTPEEALDTYGVKIDIVCPPEQSITIGSGFCNTTVPAQTGLTGFHLTNTEGNEATPHDYIDLTGTIEDLEVSNHCLGSGTAIQHINVAIKGHDGASTGTAVGVTVSD